VATTAKKINQRVRRWKFSYPTSRDRDEHSAVETAARFIREHAESFSGGNLPDDPGQLAILAIKAYKVFLLQDGKPTGDESVSSVTATANAIVEACRKFDASGET
jgi:hypothetical protein